MVSPASFPKEFLHLDSPNATLETVGGKGANLARLARAGFNVPSGFLIPTESYKAFVKEHKLDAAICDALANLDFNDPVALEKASQRIRSQFGLATVSKALGDALIIAYGWIGAPPVAIRSSATAEDLPDMSFAGQQDTFLNVIGAENLTDAVVNCWSSLWTARAIGYRARNEVPHEDVSLAVVVQKMVEADVSGVMFTSNPLTGKRDEIVIDATFGLGEALVSGQVEPDNYVVASDSHLKGDCHFMITSKTLGAKATIIRGDVKGGITTTNAEQAQIQACPDEVILQLAEIGQKIAEEYDFPQDIEWAYTLTPASLPLSRKAGKGSSSEARTGEGNLFILQSRPITSLFPLPENLPQTPLKTLFGFHVVQGILEPLTPLGLQTMQSVLSGGARVFGNDLTHETQNAFHEAAERLWIDMTSIIKHPIGHKISPTAIKSIDPAVAQIFESLLKEPDFAPSRQHPKLRSIVKLLKFAIPFWGRIFGYWRVPEKGADYFFNVTDKIVAKTTARSQPTGDVWADFKTSLSLWHEARNIFPDTAVPIGVSAIVASMVPFFGILQRFSKAIGEPQLYLEIAHGLPHNVTTEMDLFLWETAQKIKADKASADRFAGMPAFQLAIDYQQDTLPSIAQQSVAQFMSRYGMRGLGEIDLGRPRWRDEPLHIIQTLQSYLEINDTALAPNLVFKKGAEAAELAGKHFEMQVRKLKGGKLKSRLVRWGIRRYRALAGLREAPKFFAIQMMGIIHQGLRQSGKNFIEMGLLKEIDDLFFLKIQELEAIAESKTITDDIRETIAMRREARAREMRRKQLPRVLLSDGRAFFDGMRSVDNDGIFGDPVSPGVVEGIVRVVLNPHETQLQPGEILVCPGTDPAWTPLFLAASGLVMEVGGMMTHGSVVAREYGIPAVVGVHEATTRLETGMLVRVDGSSGAIEILEEEK
ncbi:MAG: hypothetical protein HN916_04995 [Anaerolineae bacterium]|nr:hypothetical protein [Anaerolineae bacterium]